MNERREVIILILTFNVLTIAETIPTLFPGRHPELSPRCRSRRHSGPNQLSLRHDLLQQGIVSHQDDGGVHGIGRIQARHSQLSGLFLILRYSKLKFFHVNWIKLYEMDFFYLCLERFLCKTWHSFRWEGVGRSNFTRSKVCFFTRLKVSFSLDQIIFHFSLDQKILALDRKF